MSHSHVERGEFRAKSERAAKRARLAQSEVVAWSPPPQEEQDRLALPVLKRAWALVKSGWCQHVAWLDLHGKPILLERQAPALWSLTGAVRSAGGGEIEAEYALRALRRQLREHDLEKWNDHALRTKRQVLTAIDKTARTIERHERRGGWRVSFRPPPPRRASASQLQFDFTNERGN